MSPEVPPLLIERMDAVCLLTLQRPDKRNALNDALIDAIDAAVAGLPDEIRAIVIHGAGEHFCAGLDLAERLSRTDRTPLQGVRHSRHWHRGFDRLQFGERQRDPAHRRHVDRRRAVRRGDGGLADAGLGRIHRAHRCLPEQPRRQQGDMTWCTSSKTEDRRGRAAGAAWPAC